MLRYYCKARFGDLDLELSLIDKIILQVDELLSPRHTTTTSPADNINNTTPLSAKERKSSVSMLRINHAGEVCAQALYQGQALMANSAQQYHALMHAAAEEHDHLQWCRTRLFELNGRPSMLNPIWYAGSLGIGIAAGIAGDKVSMGFLAETEYQVSEHLTKHLNKMSASDAKSRAILEQMREDELRHATTAENNGASKLPNGIRLLMRFSAKVLTITTARI